jgi:hypothetical protein
LNMDITNASYRCRIAAHKCRIAGDWPERVSEPSDPR